MSKFGQFFAFLQFATIHSQNITLKVFANPNFAIFWEQGMAPPRGLLPDDLGGGVWCASGNPYPISDQNTYM